MPVPVSVQYKYFLPTVGRTLWGWRVPQSTGCDAGGLGLHSLTGGGGMLGMGLRPGGRFSYSSTGSSSLNVYGRAGFDDWDLMDGG